jgi:hypothetical protein
MLNILGNAAAPYISSRPFNRHVSSDASFQLAKQWLATCDAHHERCRASARTYPPTRLINVRCGGRVDIIKVVLSHLFVPFREVRYASLSYCWGGDQAIQTSMATLERHKLGIKISNLSQTIQDAIRVTRSLGIEFLWIDSLCIVQDNPEDVAREISRMSDYFENAYICISAASAADCNEGFLQPRNGNPYHHGPFELPYRGPDNQMGSIKLVTYTHYSSSLEPGEARAWIMQESLLAPRLLSYSYRNLAWSCRQVNHSDGGPHRDKPGWHNFGERNNWADLSREARVHMNLFSMIEYWKNLVQSYSSRSLTVPTDKLPAISGIAQKYAQIISDCTYLAGIWHSPTRIRGLTPLICVQLFWTTSLCEFRFSKNLAFLREQWSRNLGGKSVQRSQEYIAPSWSWASIDGPIIYEDWGNGMAEASDFEVLDVRVDTERQQAPFGAVRSGWLTVKGRVMEFPPMNRRENVPSTEQARPGIVFRPDTEEDVKDLYKVKQRKMQAWLLEVARIGGTGKRTTPHWAATTPKGLILVADGTNYRRIGLFSLETRRDTEVTEPILETAVSLMFGEPKTITII